VAFAVKGKTESRYIFPSLPAVRDALYNRFPDDFKPMQGQDLEKQEIDLRRALTGFGIFFIVTLLLALIFSGFGAHPIGKVFFSDYGIFENLTLLFYMFGLIATSRGVWLRHKAGTYDRWFRVFLGVSALALFLALEESVTNVLDWLEVILFRPPSQEAAIETIGVIAMARIIAVSVMIFCFYLLWTARRHFGKVVEFLKGSPSFPFWFLFCLLITVAGLTELGILNHLARIEEWIEMNASFAWLIGSLISVSGKSVQIISQASDPAERGSTATSLRDRYSRLFRFLKEE
jgi:hypothetical protein